MRVEHSVFQFICQLTVNCELIIITLPGLVSSEVQLSSTSSSIEHTITQISSSWNSSGFYLCSLFRSAINIVVSLALYYVHHHQPHRPGVFMSSLWLLSIDSGRLISSGCVLRGPRVLSGWAELGSLVRNKTNTDPIIRFYWAPPSLELTACSW